MINDCDFTIYYYKKNDGKTTKNKMRNIHIIC